MKLKHFIFYPKHQTCEGIGFNTTEDGWACHLPFTYEGQEYKQCTTKGRDRLWCATLLSEDGNILQWGYCAQGNNSIHVLL